MQTDKLYYSKGFNYEVTNKTFTTTEIANDISTWTEDEIKAALVALISIHHSTNWHQVKEELLKGLKAK